MDQIKKIVETQLSERELIIFLLVKSGMSYRDLGKRLSTSHSNILRTFEAAERKLKELGHDLSTSDKHDVKKH